jgi:hypothetical protein
MLPWRPYLSEVHQLVRNQIRIFQAVSPDRNPVAYGHPGTAQAKGFCRLAASV